MSYLEETSSFNPQTWALAGPVVSHALIPECGDGPIVIVLEPQQKVYASSWIL